MKEAQRNESGPKGKNQVKSKAADAGEPRRNKKGPGDLKPRRRSIQKKKRKPRQGIRSQDPQQPSRGVDLFRHKVKGRLGQLERKRQKKKIRNKVTEHERQ